MAAPSVGAFFRRHPSWHCDLSLLACHRFLPPSETLPRAPPKSPSSGAFGSLDVLTGRGHAADDCRWSGWRAIHWQCRHACRRPSIVFAYPATGAHSAERRCCPRGALPFDRRPPLGHRFPVAPVSCLAFGAVLSGADNFASSERLFALTRRSLGRNWDGPITFAGCTFRGR